MKLLLDIESGSLNGRQFELTDRFLNIGRGIKQEHLDTSTSLFGSLFWILGGITSGKYTARRSVGKLGLTYWHIKRATAAQKQTGRFQQNPVLREEVLKWRDKV